MIAATTPHVVIIGGGFGGLYAAQALKDAPVKVTLIDKRNFHLFQPLLYQVATGGLSPGEIASPLRAVLSRQKNASVLKAEVVDLDPARKTVILRDGQVSYDTLIVATGVSHHYFGNDEWAERAPGLKTIEDALEIRRRILLAFEAAEREPDPVKRRAWMTFVVVGGGPTGVELAGALAELAHGTLKDDFSHIDPVETKILLLEGLDRLLPPYPPELSAKAAAALTDLGVTVRTSTMVTGIEEETVTINQEDETDQIQAKTILWAAGMKASVMGQVLADRTGAALDRAGRVMVEPDLTVPHQPDILVIGDLAHFAHQDGANQDGADQNGANQTGTDQKGEPLPGVAPVAMQQGQYAADLIRARLRGERLSPFRYRDKGSLAVIGRNAAVAHLGRLKFAGFPAWLAWLFIHVWFLIEFDNKLLVLTQWAWNYFTRNRGARLITGADPFPLVDAGEDPQAQDEREPHPAVMFER